MHTFQVQRYWIIPGVVIIVASIHVFIVSAFRLWVMANPLTVLIILYLTSAPVIGGTCIADGENHPRNLGNGGLAIVNHQNNFDVEKCHSFCPSADQPLYTTLICDQRCELAFGVTYSSSPRLYPTVFFNCLNSVLGAPVYIVCLFVLQKFF